MKMTILLWPLAEAEPPSITAGCLWEKAHDRAEGPGQDLGVQGLIPPIGSVTYSVA